jgi:tRNA G18 (ribose-2'-O)-methylase SpoU
MLIPVSAVDDPRLDNFRQVKDRPLLDRGLFLAEGETVVLRLLRSTLRCNALVVSEKRIRHLAHHIPPGIPTHVLPASQVSQLLGYDFHSGVVATGLVPASGPLDALVPRTGKARIVVVPEITNAENLGTLVRLAAGLGADALITGPSCVPPFTRRCVRVSMGTVFSLPVFQSRDILADLARLRSNLHITPIATVLDPDAEVLGALPTPLRQAVLFGTEGDGLRPELVAACTRKLTIPMSLGVDSLNVSTAAAIVLWELFARNRTIA